MIDIKKLKNQIKGVYKKDIEEEGDYTEPSRRLYYFNNLNQVLHLLEQIHDSPISTDDERKEWAKKIKELQIKIDRYRVYSRIQLNS